MAKKNLKDALIEEVFEEVLKLEAAWRANGVPQKYCDALGKASDKDRSTLRSILASDKLYSLCSWVIVNPKGVALQGTINPTEASAINSIVYNQNRCWNSQSPRCGKKGFPRRTSPTLTEKGYKCVPVRTLEESE